MANYTYKKFIGRKKVGESKGFMSGVYPIYEDIYEYIPCKVIGHQNMIEEITSDEGNTIDTYKKSVYLIELDGKTIEADGNLIFKSE